MTRRAWLSAAALLAACAGPPAATPRPAPALILVSIDGFRADYLDRGLTPHLAALAARGVRARWLTPTFPTKTFPQHYTIVTGLHPSRHGIVANSFVDETDGARFDGFDSTVAGQPRWWGGEPVWVTAERQGVRAGTVFWPGSDYAIGGVRPSRYRPYDGRLSDSARVDTVMAWLALPPDRRPGFLTLYMSGVDGAGHAHGPDSPQAAAAVRAADAVVGWLVERLERRGMRDSVNIVVVADHGMAATSERRLVFLEDYVDSSLVRAVESGALLTLRPVGVSADSLLALLSRAPHLRIFRSDRAPAAWRYPDGPRVPPLVGVMEEGWLATTRGALARWRNRYNGGNHGYDPADPAMRALFVAAGPSFREGVTVEPFSNVHVYELMCAVLGLDPAPNDGHPDSTRALRR